MAINNQEIADTYFGGFAELITYPIAKIPEFSDIYTPADKLPQSTKELYEYHPDKAKQLLVEAGYPNGFKFSVVCWKDQVDLLSIVKAYWAKVGVDLELDAKEYGVYYSQLYNKTYKQAVQGWGTGTLPFKMTNERYGSVNNYSMINDPRIEAAYVAISNSYFDDTKRRQMMKEIALHFLDQAYWLELPGPYIFTFWSPWVKGYNGEYAVGYGNFYDHPKYLWYDQQLKEDMTGRK